ncbi:MAG: type transport system ATP-binding protein [Chloroflexota bacterium]|nr:type transport system ATP-binding protein [Chloroflexota bacterium]
MKCIIETHQLGKDFGSLTAVNDLSLKVAEGEIYAFLGLNGAGKTTTIRMLLGMIKASRGSARIFDALIRPGSRQPWSRVGYSVEIPYAYPELSVEENLEIARRLHPGTSKAQVTRIIEELGLGEYTRRKAGILSQGNAQRLGLAKALLHDPQLLILDEPANGLDPAGIVEIRKLLLDLSHKKGVTILMSSHILAEVARMADRIGIIHKGILLQELSARELEANRRKRLVIRTRQNERAAQLLENRKLHPDRAADGALVCAEPICVVQPDQIAEQLVQAGLPPLYLAVEEENLEDYFLRLIKVKE